MSSPKGGGRDDGRRKGSYTRHDRYFHAARAQGYVARSVFKLDELQERMHLLKPGQRVLDLGCAPGSWLQLAGRLVGPAGRVVGIDLEPVTIALPPWVSAFQADIATLTAARLLELGGGHYHVLLSDLAPHTTGVRHVDQARSMGLVEGAFAFADAVLQPGGSVAAKIFDGGEVPAFMTALRRRYREVKPVRPKATREHSKELYIVALGFQGPATADAP